MKNRFAGCNLLEKSPLDNQSILRNAILSFFARAAAGSPQPNSALINIQIRPVHDSISAGRIWMFFYGATGIHYPSGPVDCGNRASRKKNVTFPDEAGFRVKQPEQITIHYFTKGMDLI
jgi:hypothetical protein